MYLLGISKRRILVFTGLIWIGLAPLAYGISAEEVQSKLQRAREDLRLSEATEARIASELERLKNSEGSSAQAIKDYETYLESVQEMSTQNRRIVEEMEAAYARYAKGGKDNNVPDIEVAAEDIDELAALDRELDDSLATFDEMLLKELDEIRTKSASRMKDLAEEAAAAAQRLRVRGITLDTSSPEETTDSQQAEEDPQMTSSENCPVDSRGDGEGRIPMEERPIRSYGQDDDIVARQIREAAENETDPELKEKLWKEYEAYKRGTPQ